MRVEIGSEPFLETPLCKAVRRVEAQRRDIGDGLDQMRPVAAARLEPRAFACTQRAGEQHMQRRQRRDDGDDDQSHLRIDDQHRHRQHGDGPQTKHQFDQAFARALRQSLHLLEGAPEQALIAALPAVDRQSQYRRKRGLQQRAAQFDARGR